MKRSAEIWASSDAGKIVRSSEAERIVEMALSDIAELVEDNRKMRHSLNLIGARSPFRSTAS